MTAVISKVHLILSYHMRELKMILSVIGFHVLYRFEQAKNKRILTSYLDNKTELQIKILFL